MIKAALIENGIVVNVIYIDAENMALFAAQGMELIDSEPIGLNIGDWRMDGLWYRNDGDDIIPLPIPQPEPEPNLLAEADALILELTYENLMLKEGLV